MKYIVKRLVFPGTILHPELGRVDLHKAKQKVLKKIYEGGSVYVGLDPGNPPNEQDIKVKSTPVPDKKPAASRKKKTTGREDQ